MTTLGKLRTRALRPPKVGIDPSRPIAVRWDVERGVRVARRPTFTVFLAGAECPFTCLFCDLWRHTLDGPTPAGALPRQLEIAIAEAGDAPPAGETTHDPGPRTAPAIKLYNASNFFDARAVPPADDRAIAEACAPFARVTVETHARLVGDRAATLADRLAGRLEIAMGLETIHPGVLPRLDKGMTLADFEGAVAWAREHVVGTRAFVLVGLPWVAADDFATWAVRSATYAAELGVERVSLIPLRAGNGALDELARRGELEPVRLAHIEEALERCLDGLAGRTIVEADLWDAERLDACEACHGARIARLAAANLEQAIGPRDPCGCER